MVSGQRSGVAGRLPSIVVVPSRKPLAWMQSRSRPQRFRLSAHHELSRGSAVIGSRSARQRETTKSGKNTRRKNQSKQSEGKPDRSNSLDGFLLPRDPMALRTNAIFSTACDCLLARNSFCLVSVPGADLSV